MKVFATMPLALVLLAISSPANAVVTVFVEEGFEADEGYTVGSSVFDSEAWTYGVPDGVSDGIPNTDPPSSAEATIVDSGSGLVQSGAQALELATTNGGGEALFRADYARDLTAPNASLSAATPMTSATVSLGINYNFEFWTKGYEHDTWIYVQSHDLSNRVSTRTTPGGRVAAVRVNGGYGEWYFGTVNYDRGPTLPSVRDNIFHEVRMELDFVAQKVTYFLDGEEQLVDQLPGGALLGTKGLTSLFIQNGMNDSFQQESNVTYVDNVFFSADIEGGACGPIGDINCDGRVDAEDLGLVRWYFGTGDGGDADGDGQTDATDLGHVRTNFGQEAAPTPEPGCLAILALGAIGLIRPRRA